MAERWVCVGKQQCSDFNVERTVYGGSRLSKSSDTPLGKQQCWSLTDNGDNELWLTNGRAAAGPAAAWPTAEPMSVHGDTNSLSNYYIKDQHIISVFAAVKVMIRYTWRARRHVHDSLL